MLARTRRTLFAFEAACKARQIPLTNTAGPSKSHFRHSREAQDLLAYADVVGSDNSGPSFARIVNTPKRKIGDVSFLACVC